MSHSETFSDVLSSADVTPLSSGLADPALKISARAPGTDFAYQQSTRYMNSPERPMAASGTAKLTIELGLGDSLDESSMTSSHSGSARGRSGRYSR